MTPIPDDAKAEADEVRAAVLLLRDRFFRRRGQDQVLVDFLEDELREGERAMGDVTSWFDEVLATIVAEDASAKTLVDLADDRTVLEQIDYLGEVVANLRKRLLQIAARVSAQ